jgi:hypothetical protein
MHDDLEQKVSQWWYAVGWCVQLLYSRLVYIVGPKGQLAVDIPGQESQTSQKSLIIALDISM